MASVEVAREGGRQVEGLASGEHAVWWQWTSWPRLVMSEIGNTARSSLLAAPGDGLADGSLGPLAAYLRGLEARVAALEAQLVGWSADDAGPGVAVCPGRGEDDSARGPRW